MISVKKFPMTEEGHRKLQEELKTLKTLERPQVIKAIAEARSHGDLSENAEYHAAREKQGFIETRITVLEEHLALAEVIDTARFDGQSQILFGAKVTLMDEDTGEKIMYHIVGEDEADVKVGRLSIASPLARSLVGRNQGEEFEVTTPRGPRSYEILTVSYV